MEIDWGSVKTEYEENKEPLGGLAKRYGFSERTLSRRATKEGWIRGNRLWKKAPCEKSEVRRGIDDESEGTRLIHVRGIDDESEDTDLIHAHRTLWKDVKKRLKKGLKKKDVKSGLEELKVAKMAGEVLTNVIKGERLAWGLNDDGGGHCDDADAIAAEMAQVTASCGADEAVDGE